VSAQDVSLGQGLVENEQRQVDRELHAGAGTHGSHELDAPAHLVEQRLGLLEVLLGAAGAAEQLALARRTDRSADRALNEDAALRPHLLGQRHLLVRLHRAHFDDQLALHVPREQAGRSLVDGGQSFLVRENRYDRLNLACQLGRTLGGLGAGVRQRLDPVRRTVPHGHRVPHLHEPRRNGRTHAADARNTDTHAILLTGRPSCQIPSIRQRLRPQGGASSNCASSFELHQPPKEGERVSRRCCGQRNRSGDETVR
jgi:hypothetical protein